MTKEEYKAELALDRSGAVVITWLLLSAIFWIGIVVFAAVKC